MLTSVQVYRSRWFGPLVVMLVLATATALGFLSVRSPYYVLALASVPLALVGLDWLLRRLHWIPVLVLSVATLSGLDLGRGLTLALIVATVFVILWLLRQAMVTRQTEFANSPVIVPGLAFAFVALLSYGWAQIGADPFLIIWSSFPLVQLGQLAVFVVSPFVLILTASLVTQARHLKYLIYMFLVLAFIGGLAELSQFPIRMNMRGMVYTWVACLSFGQLLYNRTASRWQRVFFGILVALWFYIAFLKGMTWLSGWLPGMVSIAILTFFKSKKLFLAVMLATLVFVLVASSSVESQFDTEYNESGITRLDRWQTLFEQPFVWNNWFLGMGPAGYALYFMTYIPANSMSTHSNYIDIFLQLGVLGMATLLWLLGTLTWVAYKLHSVSIRDPFIAAFARSGIAIPLVVLFAMFLGDWFTPFVYNQGLAGFSWTINSWVFLGALTAVPNIVAKEQAKNQTQEPSTKHDE